MSAPVRPPARPDQPKPDASSDVGAVGKIVTAQAPATASPSTKTIQTARIVSHPTATTLTLIGSGTATGLMRPSAAGGVTSFHISKAPAANPTRSVVAAPLVAAGFGTSPIITTAAIPTIGRAIPRAAATTVTSGVAWLPQGRPTAPQARITTYPIGQALRPALSAVATRPFLATLSKQELPRIRTLPQDKGAAKGLKVPPVGSSKDAMVTSSQTLQTVMIGQAVQAPGSTTKTVVASPLGPKVTPRATELKPTTCVLQTLGPAMGTSLQIASLTGLKGTQRAPMPSFVPSTQVKVLAAGDPSQTPTTVISSTSLLIHNTLTGGVERGGQPTANLATLPAGYFYDSQNLQGPSRLVLATAPGQMKLQAALSTPDDAMKQMPISNTPVPVSESSVMPTTPIKMEVDDGAEECITSSMPTKLNASPRPSILRKRELEGSPTKSSKIVPFSGFQSISPPTSPVPKPDSDDGKENSSGGSSTISATSSPGLLDIENMVIKPELDTVADSFSNNGFGDPLSPRKKPRKQQLSGNELQEVIYAEDPNLVPTETDSKSKGDSTPARVTGARRRSALLLPNYRTNAKLCHNHFQRPTDVRIREERRPTVAELSSQKGVAQKARGWKLYHLSTQMEIMRDRECEILSRYDSMRNEVEEHSDNNRTCELIMSNIQRSKVVRDQLDDCRSQLLKLLEHRTPVLDIIKRHANRRQAKKKY